ncbi:hypothetical protein Dimus_000608 [Dionaea muscipula]
MVEDWTVMQQDGSYLSVSPVHGQQDLKVSPVSPVHGQHRMDPLPPDSLPDAGRNHGTVKTVGEEVNRFPSLVELPVSPKVGFLRPDHASMVACCHAIPIPSEDQRGDPTFHIDGGASTVEVGEGMDFVGRARDVDHRGFAEDIGLGRDHGPGGDSGLARSAGFS